MDNTGDGCSFAAEEYRGYLRLLTQTRALGALARKLEPSDVVQETLLNAHRARDQFDGSTEKEFLGWLRKILANVIAKHGRHFGADKRKAGNERSLQETLDLSGNRLEQMIQGASPTPSQCVAREEAIVGFLAAMEQLPEDQLEAVRLRHLEGLTVQEVADLMRRTRASVAGLLRRALAHLRVLLERNEE